VNQDSLLSPAEFLAFAKASADGRLEFDRWGLPIAELWNLPRRFHGIYNFFNMPPTPGGYTATARAA